MLLNKLTLLLLCSAVITACNEKSDSASNEALPDFKQSIIKQEITTKNIKSEKSNVLNIFNDAKKIITEIETILDSNLNLDNANIDEVAEKFGSVAKKIGKNAKKLESGLSKIAKEIEKGIDEGYNDK